MYIYLTNTAAHTQWRFHLYCLTMIETDVRSAPHPL